MLFLRLKRAQNPINDLTLNSRPIHPNPNPPKIFRPKLFNNALESIMPCGTSSEFESNPSCNEINLIMKHQNRRCWNFKKPRQRSNTFSRKIHIRLRLAEQDLFSLPFSRNQLCLIFTFIIPGSQSGMLIPQI